MNSILLLEDDPLIGRALALTLKTRGYEVSVAPTGRAARTALVERPFDLLCVDVMLPDVDGLTFAGEAVTEGLHAGPVVALTARFDPDTQQRARDAGVAEFLVKPVTTAALTETIAKILAVSPIRSTSTDHKEQTCV